MVKDCLAGPETKKEKKEVGEGGKEDREEKEEKENQKEEKKTEVGLKGGESELGNKDEVIKEGKPEVKMSTKYNEDDADLIIISSDGVSFKVHTSIIVRASPVFKSMIDLAKSSTQRDPITLSDLFVEHGLVVRTALDIIYDREVITFSTRRTHLYVIEFARKWDIAIIPKVMMKEIKAHSSESRNHLPKMFAIAVELADHDTMAAVYKQMGAWVWGDAREKTPKSSDEKVLPGRPVTIDQPSWKTGADTSVKGAYCADVGSWSWQLFDSIPKPILWAMLRARQGAQTTIQLKDWSGLSVEFKKVLDTMYPEKVETDQAGNTGGESGTGGV